MQGFFDRLKELSAGTNGTPTLYNRCGVRKIFVTIFYSCKGKSESFRIAIYDNCIDTMSIDKALIPHVNKYITAVGLQEFNVI